MDKNKCGQNGVMPIYFFTVVPSNNSKMLKIPNEATKRCGGNFPNPVVISPNDGSKWNVSLKTLNGEVWLDEGWKEFAQNYLPECRHFLVFKYQGSPQLDVLIITNSSVEEHFGPQKQRDILPSHFLKCIVGSNIERAKIPNTFVRIYGASLPNPVMLRPTDGSKWEVHWTVVNDEFWLEKGWKEFCVKYLLVSDHLVLFKYEGTSQMNVWIFDESKVEKDIKHDLEERAKEVKLEDISDDDSVMILEVPPAGEAFGNRKRRNHKSVDVQERPSSSKSNTSAGLKDNQMTNMAKEYPDFFKIFPLERHSERMLIPGAFVSLAHSKGMVIKNVVLRDHRGREWQVETLPIGNKLCFDHGWEQFREENSLEDKDFIVFTHVERNVFKFKVLEESSMCEKIKDEEEKNNTERMEEEEKHDDYEEEEEEEDVELKKNKRKYKVYERDQHHCRGCKARDIASSSKAAEPQLGDLEFDAEKYIQEGNPYFFAKSIKYRPNELHVPKNMIKDFALSFPKHINLVCCQCKNIQRDEVGDYHLSLAQNITNREKQSQWRGRLGTWKDGRVCILGWANFCTRNRIKENDQCICEVVLQEDLTIEMLRVHVARN